MKETFREKLKTDIVLLDGALGTYARAAGLKDEHFEDKPGCMEYLAVSRPDFVSDVHKAYLDAGADAVETNTFGGNAVKLSEYRLSGKVYDINLAATKLARSTADTFASRSFPRYVIGSMGPTGKLPSSSDPALGDITYTELVKIFHEQALGIIDGGADALLVETGQDLLEMKAAVNGARNAIQERQKDLVIMAQCTLANNGRMLLGTEISAVMSTLGYLRVDVMGLNCSTGPVEMEKPLAFLNANCPNYISAIPNAGLPVDVDGKVVYPLDPEEMADILGRFVRKYHVDVIGGCCGTTPEHIREIKKKMKPAKKRKFPKNKFYAGFYNAFNIREEQLPIQVGERINTQGSRKMKKLLIDEDYDQIIEMGKAQQNAGARILDVCVVLTERSSEKNDAVLLTSKLGESVEIPLMIDSTDADVIEAALCRYPGTAFINSVNLEDGGEKADRIFRLAGEHGSFVVNLVIDENGMAKTVENKLKTARRLYLMATEQYGIEPHRLLFDMLTFTLGTGEEEYRDAAVKTYEAIKRFKEWYPDALTVLGASNISFGLPGEARKVLNIVFLHHAVSAGLDAAIINPVEFTAYKDLDAVECALAEDLIFNKHPDALARFIDRFEGRKKDKADVSAPVEIGRQGIDEKLKQCVLNRDKAGIIPLVDEAMKKYAPEDIINDILMNAMREVGERLDAGEMVLPYVLQAAEVMRKAIDHLRGALTKDGPGEKGKVLLATVQGDVHDIGKNLVKIILENNGFSVIDLGKQVPVEKIIDEARKHKVDAVGLSALLVSTARYMKTCVQSMHDAGLDYPVLIGGAPTNERFACKISHAEDDSVYKGGVFYARDAFTGLKIIQSLMDPEKKREALANYYSAAEGKKDDVVAEEKSPCKIRNKKNISRQKLLKPPFYGVRSLSNIPADEVFPRLDEDMLFDLGWGAKLKDEKEKEKLIKEGYRPLLREIKEESLRKGWLDLKAVYGYFKCSISGEEMAILDGAGNVAEKIYFERTKDKTATALTDYFSGSPEKPDIVAFQAVTVGSKVNDAIKEFTGKGQDSRAFLLHGLSVHLAEALASYIHDRIRDELKIKKEQGRRYSPGYPLWRSLEDQKKIFRLLEVEERLDIHLTEECQMVPEQSTTAMIVYNDRAEY